MHRPNHAHVGLVGRALGHDPLVGRGDVGVGADDGADTAVEVDAEGVLLARELAVEVDDADGWQWLRCLFDQPVELRERILDGGHVGSALEVEDSHFGAVPGVEYTPTSPGDAVGAVVERPEDPFLVLELRVNLALVPDVIPRGDHVDARVEHRLGRGGGQAHAAGYVLAVGRDEVDVLLTAKTGQ